MAAGRGGRLPGGRLVAGAAPGPWSPVVAVGVGLVAGAAALVRGAPVLGAGVAAVLGLLALLDAVHGGAALLGGAPPW